MTPDLRHIDKEVSVYFRHIMATAQSYIDNLQLCVDHSLRDGSLDSDHHERFVTMLAALKDEADEAWLLEYAHCYEIVRWPGRRRKGQTAVLHRAIDYARSAECEGLLRFVGVDQEPEGAGE